ncbi:MAG: hypothetical protein E6Q97_23095 [Desulfurellales bacterium]|nr:MAG: hypothetical protein E6Q97_23095 [Desulfurellales bacterium]
MSQILRHNSRLTVSVANGQSESNSFPMGDFAGGLVSTEWADPTYFAFKVSSTADLADEGYLYRVADDGSEELVKIPVPTDTWFPLPDELFAAIHAKIVGLDASSVIIANSGGEATITVMLKS